MRRWRTLLTPAASGVANMAFDEALMERSAATGQWICRIYGWAEPTVSLGRNQSALRHYDRARMEGRMAVVRRPTGGRAILHHREVTYCVTGPAGAGSLQESYGVINGMLLAGLRALGVVEISESGHREAGRSSARSVQPGPAPCFDHPSKGELVAGGRKLVGSAQWRSEQAFLQHGSILVDDDQGRLIEFLRDPVTPPPPAATLRELLGSAPSIDAVAHAIFSAVAADDPHVTPLPLDQSLLDSQSRLAERFADPAWTWRR